MDLRRIECIVTVEQEQSISKAAEKLYLAQSILNQQPPRLGEELDTPLFERRKHSTIPALAGRIYLAATHRMADMKRKTYKIISDIIEENVGKISIAHTSEQGSLILSCICPYSREEYLNITFSTREARVEKMEQMILQKEIIMASLTYSGNQKNPLLGYVDMGKELMMLGLPAFHLLAHLTDDNSFRTFPEVNLRLLKGDSFTLIPRETKMRDTIDYTSEEVGFRSGILLEPVSIRTVMNMVRQQICPAFSPQSYVESEAPIIYLSVHPRQTWTHCMAYLKGCYLTKPEKYYIELATWYAQGCLQNGPRSQGAAQTGISEQSQTEYHNFSK